MERRSKAKPAHRTSGAQPTLKTIADLAGLGVTTVSRALKDGPELSLKTKAKVRAIAEEIGYRPHRAGVRLKTGRTFVISFVLNQADDMSDYARRLIMGISQALSGTHYHLQVLPQNIDQDPIDPVRYIVDTQAADGLILTHSEPQDLRVKMLLEHDFPFITFGRTELATPHPYIDVDNFDFAYRAAQALITRGRKRIVIVLPPRQYTYSGHQLAGYRRALFEAGIRPRIAEGVDLYSPALTLRSYANALASGSDAPDGIICGSELQALGMILGFQEAGFVIGKDVDIVNKKTSNILDLVQLPTLQFFEDLIRAGHDCAKFLLKRIEGETPISELQRLDFTSFSGSVARS
jgi:LacI family transcriptional regulator